MKLIFNLYSAGANTEALFDGLCTLVSLDFQFYTDSSPLSSLKHIRRKIRRRRSLIFSFSGLSCLCSVAGLRMDKNWRTSADWQKGTSRM